MSAAEDLARAVAGIGGPVGVTVDGRAATATAGNFPAFRWALAPAGLATRRQLSALGLRPGGADPVASLSWRRGQRWAALYALDAAKPKRPMTAGRRAALVKAMRARCTCPDCGQVGDYVIPASLGVCLDCKYGPAEPSGPVEQAA
jgi:hypothetical protein